MTLVPFNKDPAMVEIGSLTYPVASKDGRLSYRQAYRSLDLNRAMVATFHGASIDLDKRVVFIHGVPDSTPSSENSRFSGLVCRQKSRFQLPAAGVATR